MSYGTIDRESWVNEVASTYWGGATIAHKEKLIVKEIIEKATALGFGIGSIEGSPVTRLEKENRTIEVNLSQKIRSIVFVGSETYCFFWDSSVMCLDAKIPERPSSPFLVFEHWTFEKAIFKTIVLWADYPAPNQWKKVIASMCA
jgi:hypothetical protein